MLPFRPHPRYQMHRIRPVHVVADCHDGADRMFGLADIVETLIPGIADRLADDVGEALMLVHGWNDAAPAALASMVASNIVWWLKSAFR